VEAPDPTPLTAPVVLWRGLRRRCPLCGGRHVFQSFFLVKERCPRCNFPIFREEGHWIGAIGMNTVVTFGLLLVTMLVVFTLTWDDRNGALVFVTGFAVAGITPLVFFGPSQTLWSAVYLLMRPPGPEDDIDPRWIPPARRK
jgi:uncharacterized protein (DUF983 family)